MKRLFSQVLVTYRALPISPSRRQKLKNFLFIGFGFAFARMDAYRRWKAYRELQAAAEAPVPAAIASPLTADGTWEWAGYDAVKARISAVKARQLSEVTPAPLAMIDITNEPLEEAAARVTLPVPPAEPDVSIIIPVFNHLKLTLECLLSISAHADSRVSFEVILADDASTDDTARVAGTIANLRVVRNDHNLGFLRNCNRALDHVRGRYVVYLNNDVQVTRGWLANLHETFTTQSRAGVAGPRFLYPSGHLQEAGVAFRHDGTADMVGLNDDAARPRYGYTRRVDYISGACLMLPSDLARRLGGFSEEFLPCYCEDSDLCLRVQGAGYFVYCNPASTIIHHLSKTTAAFDSEFKLQSIAANLVTLRHKWQEHFDRASTPRIIAFYPAQRGPSDVLQQHADLAGRYGIHGFCYDYRWARGKRLPDQGLEAMVATGKPDMPFCLRWTSRLDDANNVDAIHDLIRVFRDPRYLRIDGRPLLLVHHVTMSTSFAATAVQWRRVCRQEGIGEIYVAMVEPANLAESTGRPADMGCDAAVEWPQGADGIADYRDLAVRAATAECSGYPRLKTVMPGSQTEHATPGAFQAWLEEAIDQTRQQHGGDERLVFVDTWKASPEGAQLEPGPRFGHTFLEAVKNATDAAVLLRKDKHWHGD